MHHTKGCVVSFDLANNAFITALQRGFSLCTYPSDPERPKEVKLNLEEFFSWFWISLILGCLGFSSRLHK